MAETTAIAWTHSTFNPWIGCTKVGPGCDHCYAEALDKRHRWGGDTHWGLGKPRMRTSPSYWRQPYRWNKKAAASGKPWRVFCASLADVFDTEVSDDWRWSLLRVIDETPALTWLLLTKRVSVAVGKPWLTNRPNVWIGVTVVNQQEADRDIPRLLRVAATKRFVSYEPAIGPIEWALPWMSPIFTEPYRSTPLPALDWIIVGGESGPRARLFNVAWARSTVRQCRETGVAPFVKQLGSATYGLGHGRWKDHAGADPAEWPEDLRVQEFPQ